VLSAELIDRMRAATVCMSLGARVVPLSSDNLSVARLATDPVAAWRLENAPVAESDPTFERLAVLVKASVEVLQDSVNIESALQNAFARSMAVQVDQVALAGSGTAPEPRGIRNTSGVHEITGAGALASYDPLIDLAAKVWGANAAVTGIVMSPREYATLGKLKDTTNAALPVPPIIADIPRRMTTSVSITEAPGTASTVYLGDWAQLWFGVRTQLRVEVLKERYMPDAMQYGFLAWLRVDVQLAHAAAFGRLLGITPGTMLAAEAESGSKKKGV
jgi:HK97 family phage major capsid protein